MQRPQHSVAAAEGAPLNSLGLPKPVSETRVVVAMSGGVDSSSVVALMSEASDDPVRTCSIGFDVEAVDETGYAQRVAEQYATDHR
ncbi:MAG: asparagine synthase-related protein, partial [Pseudomonadota bacterium]